MRYLFCCLIMGAFLSTAAPVFADVAYPEEEFFTSTSTSADETSSKKLIFAGAGVAGLALVSFGVLRMVKNKKK